ncbi:MAG: pyocin knob domain-containing protein, partial [Bacteroidales bacterium]
TYIDSPDDMLLLRANGVERRVYTTGYKPSLDDLGALGSKGAQVLTGSLQVNPGTSADPLNLIQTFNPNGANAQGISGYNSKDNTKRAWGIGAYADSATVTYAYVGVGEAPWATGIRIKPTAIEAYQPLFVSNSTTITNPTGGEMLQLHYDVGVGGNLRGKEGGVNDWYVGRANAAGDVALYSNKHANGMIVRKDIVEFVKAPMIGSAGTIFATKHLAGLDLNTLHSSVEHGMYYQDATASATAARNYPILEAGALIVMGGAYGALQEFTGYASGRKFVRGKNSAGGGTSSWRAWSEVGGVKHHMSGYRFTQVVIPVNGTTNLMPSLFSSALGITMSNGVVNIAKSGTYKVDWGFSLLPTTAGQNAVGGLMVNNVMTYSDMIHNYCPATAFGTQMNISGTSVIAKFNAGDKLIFQVKAVNSTSANLYQGGFITIQEL